MPLSLEQSGLYVKRRGLNRNGIKGTWQRTVYFKKNTFTTLACMRLLTRTSLLAKVATGDRQVTLPTKLASGFRQELELQGRQPRAFLQSVALRTSLKQSRVFSMVVAASNGDAHPIQALSVAVIGGGAAGLVAARELQREGHRVVVYEASPHIGGVWDYSEEVESDLLGKAPGRKRVHGSMYSQLRTNLPREIMGYTDFPFDTAFPGSKDQRQFCSHDEVLRYLESFAAAFDLARLVQTSTEVVSVMPPAPAAPTAADGTAVAAEPTKGGRGQWEVTVRAAAAGGAEASGQPVGEDRLELHDAVVVCNGHYSEPRVPEFAGQEAFPNLQMHSHNYRRAEPFRGQTVVLVGASSSGVDIAQELAAVGARVYLCARAWENPLTGEILKIHPTFTEAHPGEVVQCPNIKELHASGAVTLEEGAFIPHVDTVMYCTGYIYKFPFLDGTNIITVQDNRVGPLYRHVFPPSHAPSLSFVGLPWKVVPFPQFELQSKWIARALSGRVQLPSVQEMEADIEKFYAELEASGQAVRFTHRQSGDIQWKYNQFLVEACGPDVPRWPLWRADMYSATGNSRKLYADSYRDKPLPGDGKCEEEARCEAQAVRRQQQQQLQLQAAH